MFLRLFFEIFLPFIVFLLVSNNLVVGIFPTRVSLTFIPPMGVRYFWLDPKVTKRSRLTLLAYSVHCVRCARLKPFAPLTSTALRTLSPFSPFYGHQRMPGFLSFSFLFFPFLLFPSLLFPSLLSSFSLLSPRLPLRLAFLLCVDS